MPARNQNFAMPAGDTRRLVFTVRDSAGAELSLAGASSVRWWLAPNALAVGDAVLIRKSLGSGLLVAGATVTVALDPADTDALEPGVYYHEAEIVFADMSVATVLTGAATIQPTLIR